MTLVTDSWASRTATLPAVGIVALPKCPACVMIVLNALGVGHGSHGAIFTAVQAAILGTVLALALRSKPSKWRRGAIAMGASAMVPALLGIAPDAVGYAGAAILMGAMLLAPRGSAACHSARPREA